MVIHKGFLMRQLSLEEQKFTISCLFFYSDTTKSKSGVAFVCGCWNSVQNESRGK